jgi:cysteine desulfurase/selenocysteine lyase
VQNNLDFDTYHMDLQPSAGRFEEGTPNTPGIFALGAAIDLLLELDVSAIGERVQDGLTQPEIGEIYRGHGFLSR